MRLLHELGVRCQPGKCAFALRAAFVLALFLISQPAAAHCYAVWRYPTPQRGCAATVRPVRLAYAAPKQLPARPAPPRIVPAVPPAALPSDDRALALEQLKRAMQGPAHAD